MILSLLFVSLVTHASAPKEARAIVDLGSGTVKLGLFDVLPDTQNVNEWTESMSSPLPLEAEKQGGAITEKSQTEALKILTSMREKAISAAKAHGFKNILLTVVGTHALRTATNKDEVIAKFTKEGFPTRAITQEQEARAGFIGVAMLHMPPKCLADSLVVWDVGGGSMQLTRTEKNKESFIGLEIGAEKFKEKALELKKGPPNDPSCPAGEGSPNPIGKQNIVPLKAAAKREAAQVFKNKKTWPVSCVVGIGGVHTKAIEAQINKNWESIQPCVCGKKSCTHKEGEYTREELNCLAQKFAMKNDCDPAIKGSYSKTSVTNLVMILGFMETFKISKIKTASVNMGPAFALENSDVNYTSLTVPQ